MPDQEVAIVCFQSTVTKTGKNRFFAKCPGLHPDDERDKEKIQEVLKSIPTSLYHSRYLGFYVDAEHRDIAEVKFRELGFAVSSIAVGGQFDFAPPSTIGAEPYLIDSSRQIKEKGKGGKEPKPFKVKTVRRRVEKDPEVVEMAKEPKRSRCTNKDDDTEVVEY